ncbi:transposase domain-containing protein [Pseudomonas monteilii]|nr:transposase domain-containing protein [Pseudomonas monteilii]MBA1319997.1 transposase domain-containing protein [Pseudomonas monteilii]MBA6090017.1 transposase domain-containing protein [Pseudomonas monteilii]MCT8189218.1 transposase domain-containing protein [Pseudomonas monteilii]WJN91183.1 transposase domain-containing protein [Pseudomonas monteilii]
MSRSGLTSSHSCEFQWIDSQRPYAWLRYVLKLLPHTSTVGDFEALLPWNCKPVMPR